MKKISLDSAGSWQAVYVLALLAFAMSTAETLPGAMMPLMSKGLHASEGMIGQATTATAIMAIITSLSIGKIAGKRDRRIIIIAFTGALVISNIGVAISPNAWTMLASRLLLGATIGTNWGLITSIVIRLSPVGHVAKGLSIVLAGASAAGVISSPLAAFFGGAIGWRWVYGGATVLAIIALVSLIATFPTLPATTSTTDRDLAGTLRLPGLVAGMVGIMLLFGGLQAFFGYLVPYLEDITGLGTSAVSLVLLAVGISALLGTMVAPRMLQRSIYAVLVISPALLAMLIGLLLLAGTRVLPVVILLVLWMFVRAHIGVGANAWVANAYAEHSEGAGGILVAFIQASMMLGAMLGGVLIDNVGAPAPPKAGAVILAFGAVYIFFVLRPGSAAAVEETVVEDAPVPMPIPNPIALIDDLT